MKTLIIDNYDSFTYNLYQLFGQLKANPMVFQHDRLSLEQITELDPTHIVISPGPGTVENTKDFGICEKVILEFMSTKPILGVCLGHQGIAKALGGSIEPAPHIMHGKQSLIEHNGKNIFKGVTSPFKAMRYHSLCVSPKNLPEQLIVTAHSTKDNVIMALEHCQYPLFGIQFHPESFGTPQGQKILSNFLSYAVQKR